MRLLRPLCNTRGLRIVPAASGSAEAAVSPAASGSAEAAVSYPIVYLLRLHPFPTTLPYTRTPARRLPYRVPSEATPYSYNITLLVSLYMCASSRVSARTNVLGREVIPCNYNIMVSFYVCGSSRVSAHTRAPRRCAVAHTHTHTHTHTSNTYTHSDLHEFV